MIKKLGILLVFLIVFLFLFNSVIMPLYVKHADLVKVPNVVGMNLIDAKKIIEDSGLEVKQGDIRYDEQKPVNQVLEQNPVEGETVKKGRRVYLTICGGEQLMEVPKLSGRSLRDAKFSLEQRNLQVGEIVKKFSNEFPEDVVISQIIQPGSKVKKSTKIDLIISNGPQIGDILIPDVIGKKLTDAKKIIEEKKLKVGKVTYQFSDKPQGIILDQYPKKDKSAKENTSVDLFVSKKRVEIDKTYDENFELDGQNNVSKESNNKNKAIEPEKVKEASKEKGDNKNKEKPVDKNKDKDETNKKRENTEKNNQHK